eukprot:878898-Rhodomonas_salina.4
MRQIRTWSVFCLLSSRTSPPWGLPQLHARQCSSRHHRAHGDADHSCHEGKAWGGGRVRLCQETSSLTLDMVQQVVKLAENHLACIKSNSIMGGQDLVASPAVVTENVQALTTQAGLEQQVNIQPGAVHSLEEKLS